MAVSTYESYPETMLVVLYGSPARETLTIDQKPLNLCADFEPKFGSIDTCTFRCCGVEVEIANQSEVNRSWRIDIGGSPQGYLYYYCLYESF